MRKFWLSVFLFAPVVVIGLLTYWISASLDKGIQKQPPIGAGAGATGGANAIGEALRSQREANGVVIQPTNGAAAPAPQLVDPTTLEQGFVLVVEDKAKLATADSPIYLAGNVNNWNPGDPAFRLTPQSDMRWRIMLTKPRSRANPNEPIQFKFTRGTWEREELRDDMSPPANRTLPKVDISKLKPGEVPTIELSVSKWGDMRPEYGQRKANDPYRSIQATGTLRRLQVRGGVGASASQVRDLLVWLPPGYDSAANADRRYPVLYMMDGQNIFEQLPNVAGEWTMDETATELVTKGLIEPIIIVGVPHSGTTRAIEYMPPVTRDPVIDGMAPAGDQHVQWLMSEVLPRVQRAFRVETRRERVAIGGSSLGALISLYAATQHPEAFGMVLAESPALALRGINFWRPALESAQRWPDRISMAVGTREGFDNQEVSTTYLTEARAFNDMLTSKGFGDRNRRFVVEQDAEHNEGAWAKRLPEALRFLFPPAIDGTK